MLVRAKTSFREVIDSVLDELYNDKNWACVEEVIFSLTTLRRKYAFKFKESVCIEVHYGEELFSFSDVHCFEVTQFLDEFVECSVGYGGCFSKVLVLDASRFGFCVL